LWTASPLSVPLLQFCREKDKKRTSDAISTNYFAFLLQKFDQIVLFVANDGVVLLRF
jgi:hypothetical protein